MAGISFAFRQADRNAIKFEAMVYRVGQGHARTAFARALTHEGRKASTQVKRSLRKETSIRQSHISKAVKFLSASPKNLRAVTEANDRHLELRHFGPKQIKKGVSAMVWGRRQRFPGAFVVASVARGGAFVRTGKFNQKSGRLNAIRTMYGPNAAKEMVEDETAAVFDRASEGLAARAMHELNRILNG